MLEKKYSADQSSRLKALIRKVFFIEIEEAKKGRFLLYRGMEKDIPEGALKTKQKEGEEDFYYCRSLSYGASLYAGVLYDRYERSACALIHMLDPTKKAYLLSLDKSAYREGKLPFYFPPIHVTASFNGWGEFFHPRAKFSPFGKNGKKVEGISIFAFRFLNADLVNELMSVPFSPEELDLKVKEVIQASQISIQQN
jgi:hypothetical protein